MSVLICRLTFLRKRKQFSTGLFINPEHWNSKQQFVDPLGPDREYINTQLSLIRNNLNQAFLFLQVKGTSFTVQDIYNQYKGETPKDEVGVMEAYRLHSDRIKKLVGIDIKDVTYQKYLESGKHIQDFIRHKFKSNDIHLKALRSSFLDQYSYFLKTEKNLAQSTLNKAIQRFRRVIKYAVAEDYLNKDPFILFKYKTVKKEVVFLSVDELQKLEDQHFDIPRLEKVKDLFVFCCYTGLAYKEMASIRKEDIVKEFDDNLWLNIRRSKTKKGYKIPLLPKALEIINKYNMEDDVLVFKNISNQRFNGYLKEIADVVGIKKKLTHHIARKTFASTVLLYNDVPMEIVSELLGHSSIKTTEASYGKIVQRSVSKEIGRVSGLIRDR
jgi:integrase